MSDLYFTTFHGPIVGELWRHRTGHVVEILSVSVVWDSTAERWVNGVLYPGIGSTRLADHPDDDPGDATAGGMWGAAPFMRDFTRIP